MPVHLKRDRHIIVLPMQPENELIAELAELLVATGEATQDEVAGIELEPGKLRDGASVRFRFKNDAGFGADEEILD